MTDRVIKVKNEDDFLRQSGVMFLDLLRETASHPHGSEGSRKDWAVVARWIGHSSGELTAEQSDKLERAWIAYLAIGVAPSADLQEGFSMFAQQLAGADMRDRPPTEVMDVFDRLMASDAEIKAKRAADMKRTKAELRPLLDSLYKKRRPSWWRRQPPIVRHWAFGSLLWACVVSIGTLFFDPLNVGGWGYMRDEEIIRFWLIVVVPVAAGAAYYVYRKWVR